MFDFIALYIGLSAAYQSSNIADGGMSIIAILDNDFRFLIKKSGDFPVFEKKTFFPIISILKITSIYTCLILFWTQWDHRIKEFPRTQGAPCSPGSRQAHQTQLSRSNGPDGLIEPNRLIGTCKFV